MPTGRSREDDPVSPYSPYSAAKAAGEERSNRAVTAAIRDLVGKPWSLVRSVADRPGRDRRYAIDGSRLRALGWGPRVSFELGIGTTVAWYREHEPWWRSARGDDWDDYYRRQYGWRIGGSAGT